MHLHVSSSAQSAEFRCLCRHHASPNHMHQEQSALNEWVIHTGHGLACKNSYMECSSMRNRARVPRLSFRNRVLKTALMTVLKKYCSIASDQLKTWLLNKSRWTVGWYKTNNILTWRHVSSIQYYSVLFCHNNVILRYNIFIWKLFSQKAGHCKICWLISMPWLTLITIFIWITSLLLICISIFCYV